MITADAEGLVIEFLGPRLDAPVGTKVPNPRPTKFVRVWRSGGAAVNRIYDAPHITVTAWGSSTVDAQQRAQAARSALLQDAGEIALVRGSEEVGGLYYDPDPATGSDRYTFTVMLRIRAARA